MMTSYLVIIFLNDVNGITVSLRQEYLTHTDDLVVFRNWKSR